MSEAGYPKRLIEVDLPIKRISEHARREKSIRHGHISTLHIWWARRPLAACRAVLCAALWPDPADPLCPPAFREAAARTLGEFAARAVSDRKLAESCAPDTWGRWQTLARQDPALDPANPKHLHMLRYLLLDFIADFANWDNSNRREFLEASRALTRVAHETLGGVPGTRPLVVDPFAGGGAIPLEALRVGADAFASDLNPVAVLLNKLVLEYVPQYGNRLALEVRKQGQWIDEQARRELAEFYPSDQDGAKPIAYLWARTIICEGPGCGAEVPLLRSLWLAKKGARSIGLRMLPDPHRKAVEFSLLRRARASDMGEGTLRKGVATCPCCGYSNPVSSVRRQLNSRVGGAASARLLAVRRDDPETGERSYRLPTDADLLAVGKAGLELRQRASQDKGILSLVPDEPLPPRGSLGFRVQLYGMRRWGDLFTPRQALALSTFARLAREVGSNLCFHSDDGLAKAVHLCLALAVDRLADFNSSLCVLNAVGGRGVVHTFGRQALPMVWDFVETNPFNDVGANWIAAIEALEQTLGLESTISTIGQAHQASATAHPLPDHVADCVFTDPPYYDAVPYADLSDFFLVWLKRTVGSRFPDLLASTLSPKDEECIVDETKGKSRTFFERTMAQAMRESLRVLASTGIGIIVFAHKSTAGWEAQLQALTDAGWTITASWPIDTERPGRLRAQDSAALASSIHLICRPRRNASAGYWRDILGELQPRIHSWMPRLAEEGVVGADAIFACLGPALEIYSRYDRVEKASGEQVTLREYLEYVWAAVAKEALDMIFRGADASGLEEDARLTAMWLWTLSTEADGKSKAAEGGDEDEGEDEEESARGKKALGGYVLEYDAARKIAQGLGVHLEQLDHLVEIKGEKARLLPVAERRSYLLGKEIRDPAVPKPATKQLALFEPRGGAAEWDAGGVPEPGRTALDRVQQSMLLFAAGRSEALKRFLVDGGVGSDARFWRLAQALSALYPAQSEEKRWVDGVLARKKGLGL